MHNGDLNAWRDYLPDSIADLADIVGFDGALVIVDHWGGLEKLWVPSNMTPDHQIAQAIGLDKATALAHHYRGDYLGPIPRCQAAIRAARNAQILALTAHGHSAAKLARRFGLTTRQIWSIRSTSGPARPPIDDMFPETLR